jgi:hypothetical protein
MELDIVEWRLVLTCPAHQVSERRDAQGNLLAVLTWSIIARYPSPHSECRQRQWRVSRHW